jgi:SAM-dependent methyltransferase
MADERFEDHFSRQAEAYARHRPRYPDALLDWLSALAPSRKLAWDCGTGSGQVATALAERFERVVATDASAGQIAHATPHERVDYRVEPAGSVSLADGSVDLITVAAALHWFDLEPFYAEVKRVGRRDGIIAAWTYWLPSITPEIDARIAHYAMEIVFRSWPERIERVVDHYETLPFPFEEIAAPRFATTAEWDLDSLEGYIDTWSATQRYLREHGRHPLDRIHDDLQREWGGAGRMRTIHWPLYLRVGRVGEGS